MPSETVLYVKPLRCVQPTLMVSPIQGVGVLDQKCFKRSSAPIDRYHAWILEYP